MARQLTERDKWIIEQIFQQVRRLYLEKHIVVSREEFARARYPIVTNCWGLAGIIKNGATFELIPESGPTANGARRGPSVKVGG